MIKSICGEGNIFEIQCNTTKSKSKINNNNSSNSSNNNNNNKMNYEVNSKKPQTAQMINSSFGGGTITNASHSHSHSSMLTYHHHENDLNCQIMYTPDDIFKPYYNENNNNTSTITKNNKLIMHISNNNINHNKAKEKIKKLTMTNLKSNESHNTTLIGGTTTSMEYAKKTYCLAKTQTKNDCAANLDLNNQNNNNNQNNTNERIKTSNDYDILANENAKHIHSSALNNINDESSHNYKNNNNCAFMENNNNHNNNNNISQKKQLLQHQRTKDQESAYRRIEDVHNYAKLQHYNYATTQNYNDNIDDDDDDDDDNDEDEESDADADVVPVAVDNEFVYNAKNREEGLEIESKMKQNAKYKQLRTTPFNGSDDITTNQTMQHNTFYNIQNNQQQPAEQQQKLTEIHDEMDEHIDVETLSQKADDDQQSQCCEHEASELHNRTATESIIEPQLRLPQLNDGDILRPEHHARRPMNAFLIFCKRHRAIVKERYKSLENRAITKILGDWWASLDEQEKHCYTNLAQQNKDAFFSANPNFKWYKLPAPPLRTLATRPSNAFNTITAAVPGSALVGAESLNECNSSDAATAERLMRAAAVAQTQQQQQPTTSQRNYFKLADETQMGELSALMCSDSINDKNCTLQQIMLNAMKRRIDESYTSNSSEEDHNIPPTQALSLSLSQQHKAHKTVRRCKGRIYQELVNAGCIVAATTANAKKIRLEPPSNETKSCTNLNASAAFEHAPQRQQQQQQQQQQAILENENIASLGEYNVSYGENFDLEERIKELPARSLDDYLQRKRNTKKKKKFNGKKQRNSHSASSSSVPASATACHSAESQLTTTTTTTAMTMPAQEAQVTPGLDVAAAATTAVPAAADNVAVVGSQKRKARKESITRRDLSIIEQEVASILPLTINGCYFFNERTSPSLMSPAKMTAIAAGATTHGSTPLSASPPLSSSSSASHLSFEHFTTATDPRATSSDLLILAEVAAKRTELAN